MDWLEVVEREAARYEDGVARLAPEQLVRIGNAAYGAGLALLMLGRETEARTWLGRAATRWRESWEHATPGSWGRPIGTIKAALIAGADDDASTFSRWALGLGCEDADSSIGRYAATLALLALARWDDAGPLAATLRGREDFPSAVADALAAIAAGDGPAYSGSARAVIESFERRTEFLEDVRVADTALALQALARRRGIASPLPASALLPPTPPA
jgi:hypothetical protein